MKSADIPTYSEVGFFFFGPNIFDLQLFFNTCVKETICRDGGEMPSYANYPAIFASGSAKINFVKFSVSCHSKQIKIKFKTVRQIKSRIREKKDGEYGKTPAKIQFTATFLMQDIQRKRFTQIYSNLYGDAILVPIRIGTNMAAGNQRRHLSLSFATNA